ncbi:hypothetical protein N780_15300 [Pontibacillus chungwhensis BH030062]|uniref:Uncharacterized protein n=1 Tax=Pontibacillus chungwhensis BH030062 TaxID=1385513 RepID=A0A0A2UUK9_9BACI|nr:hypothetical protein [Pontibacillus chungwhensis]KGP91977.1 hypothetical protein N780_15300 [Pontibacillus chungwhensis BH030062]
MDNICGELGGLAGQLQATFPGGRTTIRYKHMMSIEGSVTIEGDTGSEQVRIAADQYREQIEKQGFDLGNLRQEIRLN